MRRAKWGAGVTLVALATLSVTGSESRPGAGTVARQPQPERQASAATSPPGLGRQPLVFEANRGQADAEAAFVARGSDYRLSLTAGGAVFASGPASTSAASVIRLDAAGADTSAPLVGLDPLPGIVNSYLGTDPDHWQTGIPTYARVAQRGVYPGIDLVWYGDGDRLEYDVLIAPGTDPRALRLVVGGADAVSVEANGDLVISTATGRLIQPPPVAYQDVDGQRRPVEAGYVVQGSSVSLRLGGYDPGLALVVDPVVYSTYLGGGGTDAGDGIALDASGNSYITGRTASTDFPTTAGLDTTRGGLQDAYVTKLNPTGTVAYSTYLGGSGFENSGPTSAVAVDGLGNAYVTGTTASTDFPATPGLDTTLSGSFNAFVTKLGPTGALSYSTYLGGTSGENGTGIAVDSSLNAYVTGTTSSVDFPTTPPLDTTRGGVSDAFVTKLSPSGTISYSTFLGGSGDESGFGIALDALSDAYVSGTTPSADFPATAGLDTTLGGAKDAFVAKLDPTGLPSYATYLGGGGNEDGRGIAVDGAGSAYITGTTASADFPATAGLDTSRGGLEDAFVAKLAPAGSVAYATYLGGSGFDDGTRIGVDGSARAYVAGRTVSIDFPTTPSQDSTRGGSSDGFVTKLSALGALSVSTYLGGGSGDDTTGIAVDGSARVYVTGQTASSDFPATPGLDTTNGGLGDAYVTKLSLVRRSVADFDGDGTTDVSVFRPSTGTWYVSGGATIAWGTTGDVAVPGDYDGNGTSDVGVFRPSTATWYVSGGATTAWGTTGDMPVPGDYDGNGTADVAVFRPSTGTWYVSGGATAAFGTSGDVPVPGDYDGNGTTDRAVFRPSTGTWYVSGGVTTAWGTTGDVPVPGDYDGNGTTDIAVFRPSTGTWYVSGGATMAWGASGDVPVPGDYDGNGTTDIAVFRPSTGTWYVSGGATTSWGASGDHPLPLGPAVRVTYFP